jgi:hypothetical protein
MLHAPQVRHVFQDAGAYLIFIFFEVFADKSILSSDVVKLVQLYGFFETSGVCSEKVRWCGPLRYEHYTGETTG